MDYLSVTLVGAILICVIVLVFKSQGSATIPEQSEPPQKVSGEPSHKTKRAKERELHRPASLPEQEGTQDNSDYSAVSENGYDPDIVAALAQRHEKDLQTGCGGCLSLKGKWMGCSTALHGLCSTRCLHARQGLHTKINICEHTCYYLKNGYCHGPGRG